MDSDLRVLLRAPAKPQQKLFFLYNYLLPKQYHALISSKFNANVSRKADTDVRKAVRQILQLPHDVPKAAFHSKVADGGLRVPCLRFRIPLIAKKRLI